MTIFASWYCTMKPLTTSGKGSVSVAGKHPLKRCRFRNWTRYILLDNAVFLHPLFRFAVLFIQPFLFLGQPFVLGFQGVQIGELFHALFFQGLCRSFIENQRAFMLTPELCLILCFAVFHRHGPELLIRGDVLYQHRHIRKPVFHSFEGSGGLVAGGSDLIVFHYQLRHIGQGRQRMKDYIHEVQPKLMRYTELVQEIRGKSKERKSLFAEKKETPFYLIPKQHELSRRIAELTEELEELKSEKDMLLHSLECTDDAGITAVKKDIFTMDATLKKLSQQEEKYTAELNDALQQYAELKSQSAEFDSDKLQNARLALRPAMERSAVDCVQSAYGDRY